MTKKELALKTVAELRELAAGYGHKLAARVKSGIVDELAGVIKKTGTGLKTKAKKTSEQTSRTVKAVKKAVAAGKKAAAAAKSEISKKKAVSARKTAASTAVKKPAKAAPAKAVQAKKKTAAPRKVTKAKPSTKPAGKKPSGSAVLELNKKDLQGMTVTELKNIARPLGLKQSYANKDEFVTALAKDLAKLRAEARKKAAKPTAKKVAKTAAKKVVKPAAKETAKPAAKKTAKLAKPKARKAKKPSGPSEGKVARVVKPAVHALVEKARELAVQVREKVAPSIKPAKPRVAKKKKAVNANQELHGISMPHIAAVPPAEERAMPPVELLAAVAVEPTELFISWVLDPRRILSGRLVLRVLDEGGGYFDTPVDGLSGSTYIRVLPGRRYQVSAGMMDDKGTFTVFHRSNSVTTPPGDVQPLEKQGHPALPEEFYVFTPQEYGSH